MVTALHELFAKSKQPSHEDQESAAHTLASIIEQAQAIGHAHAAQERGIAWGGNFSNALSSAWDIVTNFVGRMKDWITGQESGGADLSEDDVVAEIDSLASTVAGVEVASAIEQEVLDSLQSQGFMQIAWIAQPGACPLCVANAEASPLPIGSEWPSGDTIPPAHPHCRCSIGSAGDV
jgi:hypothetical protein